MGDRTAAWLRDATTYKEAAEEQGQGFALFAPILPVSLEMQGWYLRELVEDFREDIDGLYVHDSYSVVDLPHTLQPLPRLAFVTPAGPSELLHQISLGMDLFITPFIGSATDMGIALTFSFPAPCFKNRGNGLRSVIGIDLWDAGHATDISPFVEGCSCYACQKHHRAFLHHLLSAKEMLAWVLLQIHNHHIMEQFFAAVRTSITSGTFEKDREAFNEYYEPELPITAGKGPRHELPALLEDHMLTIYRIRGYQVKSTGRGEPKKNTKAFNKLDDMTEALAEAEAPSPDVDAEELRNHGMGKPQ
jgi:queuine tRNA-ribosyltransferase